MRRFKFQIYITIMVLLSLLLSSVSYVNAGETIYKNNNKLVMDSVTELQIRNEYLEMRNKIDSTLDDIVIDEYYGNYNGLEVFILENKQDIMSTEGLEVRLGGYKFSFGYSAIYYEYFLCWEPGKFMTVKEAYESGSLTSSDIYQIGLIRGDIPDFESVPYKDIDTKMDWFSFPVYDMYARKLMSGLRNDMFGPYEILCRAQFATILSRMEDAQSVSYDGTFRDVAEGEWYTDAVLWAAENKIVTGYENGCFGPADYITREQMAVMLYRYAEYKGYDMTDGADLTDYPDASDVSDFANNAVSWCVSKGIISGNDGKLLPQGKTSRAECAAMISRFVDLYE